MRIAAVGACTGTVLGMDVWIAVALTAAGLTWAGSVCVYMVTGLMFSFGGSVATAVGCAVSAALFTVTWLSGAGVGALCGMVVTGLSCLVAVLTAVASREH